MTVHSSELGAARVITWDRQARRNAWDLDTMAAIADAIKSAAADETVRCTVLRGAGEHFSAGDDLGSAAEADAAAWTATIEAFQRLTREALASPCPSSPPSTAPAWAAPSSSRRVATYACAPTAYI
jgi:enoyl-CoA hydratase/carnithine racemase